MGELTRITYPVDVMCGFLVKIEVNVRVRAAMNQVNGGAGESCVM